MFYVIVIVCANLLNIAGNYLFRGEGDIGRLGAFSLQSVAATVTVIAIDGLTAFIIRRLPERWFAPDSDVFAVGDAERRFYKRIKVKAWKDKVPELGGFSGFHKDKLQSRTDGSYLARFLLESNYGVVIHIANAVFGALILPIPYVGGLCTGIPVFVTNFILSMMPVAVLRANTPTLRQLYKRSLSAK